MSRWSVSLTALSALVGVGALAAGHNDGWTQPARYVFEYRVDLAKLATTSPERLRLWLPYPAQTVDQKVLVAKIDSPWPYQVNQDSFGNQIVYIEGHGVPASGVTMRFEIERRPSGGVRRADVAPNTPLDPQRYVQPNQLIPLNGLIRQLAEQESRGLTTDAEKVRTFYGYIVRNLRYNKEGTGWGRGDAIWACTNKRGNCTDFHSLFIGMARSQGIPARFIIGFPIPADAPAGVIPGYHCWAEFYDQTSGWVPLDASEANKSGWFDAYFGWLPNDRIQFTTGRDLVLEPPQQGPPLNYFVYPYAEADGTPVTDLPTTFRFERLPLPPREL